jgi:hypothetical protein
MNNFNDPHQWNIPNTILLDQGETLKGPSGKKPKQLKVHLVPTTPKPSHPKRLGELIEIDCLHFDVSLIEEENTE